MAGATHSDKNALFPGLGSTAALTRASLLMHAASDGKVSLASRRSNLLSVLANGGLSTTAAGEGESERLTGSLSLPLCLEQSER